MFLNKGTKVVSSGKDSEPSSKTRAMWLALQEVLAAQSQAEKLQLALQINEKGQREFTLQTAQISEAIHIPVLADGYRQGSETDHREGTLTTLGFKVDQRLKLIVILDRDFRRAEFRSQTLLIFTSYF